MPINKGKDKNNWFKSRKVCDPCYPAYIIGEQAAPETTRKKTDKERDRRA